MSKPDLKAVDGKGEPPKAASAVRSEEDLRAALTGLVRRLQAQKVYLSSVAFGREDWRGVSEGVANVQVISAHIEAIRFALGEVSTIR